MPPSFRLVQGLVGCIFLLFGGLLGEWGSEGLQAQTWRLKQLPAPAGGWVQQMDLEQDYSALLVDGVLYRWRQDKWAADSTGALSGLPAGIVSEYYRQDSVELLVANGQVYRQVLGRSQWQPAAAAPSGLHHLLGFNQYVLALSAAGRVQVSVDNGQNWTSLPQALDSLTQWAPLPGVGLLALRDESAPWLGDTLLVNWRSAAQGLAPNVLHQVYALPVSGTWLGFADRNLLFCYNRDQDRWKQVDAPTAADSLTAFLEDSNGVWWLGDQQGRIYRSPDGGANWQFLARTRPPSAITTFCQAGFPQDSIAMHIGARAGLLAYNPSGDPEFLLDRSPGLAHLHIQELHTAHQPEQVFCRTEQRGLWLSDTAQAHALNAGLTQWDWTSLCVAPNRLWLGLSTGDMLAWWNPADSSWRSSPSVPPGFELSALTWDPTGNQLLAASTFTGVFATADSGQTWRELGRQPPLAYVEDLAVTGPGAYWAATRGQGLWRLDTAAGPQPAWVQQTASLLPAFPRQLLQQGDTLWLRGDSSLLWRRLSDPTGAWAPHPYRPSGAQLTDLLLLPNGHCLLATANQGLYTAPSLRDSFRLVAGSASISWTQLSTGPISFQAGKQRSVYAGTRNRGLWLLWDELEVVDTGTVSRTRTTGQPEPLQVWPNPAQQELRVSGLPLRTTSLQLLDSRGAVVRHWVARGGPGEQQLSLRHLPGGLYYLRANSTQAAPRPTPVLVVETP